MYCIRRNDRDSWECRRVQCRLVAVQPFGSVPSAPIEAHDGTPVTRAAGAHSSNRQRMDARKGVLSTAILRLH